MAIRLRLTGERFTGATPQTRRGGTGPWSDATFESTPPATDTGGVISLSDDSPGDVAVRVTSEAGSSSEETYTIAEPAQAPTLTAVDRAT